LARKRLLIEGWRFIPHSFALVAQSHCLCLLQRDDIELRFSDQPYYYDTWRRTRGVFTEAQESALAALRAPEDDFLPDATFTMRAERPDFSAPRSGRRFSFGTAEYRVLVEANRSGLRSGAEVPDTVSIVTPSRWAARAYERFGLPSERIHVVPHGIDPEVLHPDSGAREATRRMLGLENAFVYLNVGAMTGNKGLDVLLSAFARVIETEPDARLFLKGTDALYQSHDMLREIIGYLPLRDQANLAQRLIYNGETYSSPMMANLLRAADVYVSPYRAEGFNMPVLEAAASGLPVICTGGGPTDEFTREDFAWRIRSATEDRRFDSGEVGQYLSPDVDHLVELMRRASRERNALPRMGTAGAAYAASDFTWQRVTDRLLGILFP
jgi:glycosyltransferase involved in cell wall biosynthesis